MLVHTSSFEKLVERAYNHCVEEGNTEPKEKRQGSVGVWRKSYCWEEKQDESRCKQKGGRRTEAEVWKDAKLSPLA